MYSECVTVWSDAPTTGTPAAFELGGTGAQLVVGLTDLQPEVVQADVTAWGIGAASAPTSMRSNSWWVRPELELNAAAGMPGGVSPISSNPRTSP